MRRLCFASITSRQVIKGDNFGLERPLDMIEMGKHSAFVGPVCNKDYHDAPSISRYCIGSEFAYRTNVGPSKQLDSYSTKLLSIRLKT